MDDDSSQQDSRFLPDFPTDSFFYRFGGLAEPSESRIPMRRPALLSS
jgi:hypothetical protein